MRLRGQCDLPTARVARAQYSAGKLAAELPPPGRAQPDQECDQRKGQEDGVHFDQQPEPWGCYVSIPKPNLVSF